MKLTLEDLELICKKVPVIEETLLEITRTIEKESNHKTYRIGDRFNVILDGRKIEVILAKVSTNMEVAFITLEDGNLYFYPIKVKDLHAITEEELNEFKKESYLNYTFELIN